MDQNAEPAQAQMGGQARPGPSQRFVLTPHRSLSARGFLILMALFGGICLVTGLVFLWIGAWPVMGFLGLDVLLLYVAFKVNYRAGLMTETIEISPQSLRLVRRHPSGWREAYEVNAYWAQIYLATGTDGRTALTVGAQGKSVTMGAFLTDDERRDLAQALRAALSMHRLTPGAA